MNSTEEIKNYDKGLFLLLKGNSGSGKTTQAISFPKPIVLDFDRKMPNVALKHYKGKPVNWKTFKEVQEIVKFLDELEKECPFETIILDSITGLSTLIMGSVARLHGDFVQDKFDPKNWSIELSKKKKTIEWIPIHYYNAEVIVFEQYLFNVLKSLWERNENPKHIICIAHEIEIEYEDLNGDKHRDIRIVTNGRKVAAWLPTIFDEVWNMDTKINNVSGVTSRFIYTKSEGISNSQTAYDLPAKIDVTTKDLFSYFKNCGKK
jgi:hypothetical protein